MLSILGMGMLYGTGVGLDIYGTLRTQDEIDELAEFEAEEKRMKAAALGAVTAEKLHDLAVEKTYAVGAAKAAGAASGVKVGTGTALTQEKSIAGQFNRKMEVLAKKVGFERAALEREAREVERRADYLKEKTWWDFGGRLLDSGFQFGLTQGWFD